MNDSIFDTMTDNIDFAGYGYLGGRLRLTPEQRAGADEMVLAQYALRADAGTPAGEATLFEWANSRLGRWFAESWVDGGFHGPSKRYLSI